MCTTLPSFLMITHLFCKYCIFSLCIACSNSDINPLVQLQKHKAESKGLIFNTPVQSDPTVRSHCLHWLLSGQERSLGAGFGTWHKLTVSCVT